MNFFTFAVNETTAGSLYYLSSVFGSIGTVLTGPGSAILGAMFKVFNTAVLAVGTLIISYTTAISIVLTAHEGEMLGKKFHSIWVPLRTVLGMGALVPAAGGYSYLQIALMWFIIQGVGAADTLWTTVVNYMNAGGGIAPVSQASASTSLITVRQNLGTLFTNLVCQAADRADGITTPGYTCSGSTGAWCQSTDMLNITGSQMSNNVYHMGKSGECGSLTLGGTNAVGQAQNNAYQQIVTTFGAIAAQVVSMDDALTTFINTNSNNPPTVVQAYCAAHNITNGCTSDNFKDFLPSSSNTAPATTLYFPYLNQTVGDFIGAAASLYLGTVNVALTSSSSSNVSNAGFSIMNSNSFTNRLGGSSSGPTDNGWIFAGAYFYNFILWGNNKAALPPTPDVPGNTLDNGSNIMTNMLAKEAGYILNEINKNYKPSDKTNLAVNWTTTCYGLAALCQAMVDGWIATLSGSGGVGNALNPIVNAQIFGTALIQLVEVGLAILFTLAAGIWGPLSGLIFGTGLPGEGLSMEFVILPIVFFIAVIILGIGATFAVYVPMVPYMLFAFGAINWIVATIETMIAGPIIAVGLLYPEGQHEIWGKAEPAIMLLLNIFLRPSLMIFGMIAAMLLSYVAISYINQGFLSVVSSLALYMSFTEAVLFMVLYTSIFTTTLNKCFELIHVVPDRILRWVGGGHEQFGEGGAGGAGEKVGRGFEAGAGKAEQLAGSSERQAGAAGVRLKEQAKTAEKKKEMDDAGRSRGSPGGGAPPPNP